MISLFYYTYTMRFKLIIGLGNPSEEYKGTYHNVGFEAIDFLTKPDSSEKQKWGASSSKKFEYLKINGVIFAKSLVFMNQSGEAAASAIKYFHLKPEQILVIHDDSDIYLGSYKLSFGRGAAGHHGIENINCALKNAVYWRLRIGIRPKEISGKRKKAEEFVLKKIKAADKKILISVFQKITELS